MIAAKHMDIVLGVDIHINIIPPGAPTPIPHLLVGMIFDPFDYIPYLGQTIVINNFLAAQPMTEIVDMPPQFPMAGPFQMLPENKGEIMTGSMSVGGAAMTLGELKSFVLSAPGKIVDWFSEEGEAAEPESISKAVAPKGPAPVIPPPIELPPAPAPQPMPPMPSLVFPLSRLGDITLGCADIGSPAPEDKDKKGGIKRLSVPMASIIAIPKGFPVMVGGPPSIAPPSAIAMRIGMKFGMKLLGKLLKKAATAFNHLLKRVAKDNPVSNRLCRWGLEPIDLATGKMSSEREDFSLPGPVPLVWNCIYYSNSSYQGPLGLGWHHSYDMSLSPEIQEGLPVLRCRMEDGRWTIFPQLEIGDTYFDPQEKLDLFRDEEGYYLRNKSHLFYRFHEGSGKNWPLASVSDSSANAITFTYDDLGGLSQIVDSAGRILRVDTDIYGHIIAIHAPHPDEEGKTFPIVRYEFNIEDKLTAAIDALGHPFRYHYDGKLMTRLTYRHGLNFYYKYDSEEHSARCTHSHGDGGLYNGNIVYEEGKTVLERIVGNPDGSVEHFFETYYHRGGLVYHEIDALGHEKRFEYDEGNNLVAEIDALGYKTSYAYDERGNLIETTYPDDTQIRMVYSEDDLLLGGVDQIGGEWCWEYDEMGRMIKRIDSMRRASEYSYNEQGQLTKFINPAGEPTFIGYNSRKEIEQLTMPNNASYRWEHNLLGQSTVTIDPKGNVEHRIFDLRGQIVVLEEPDGNARELKYNERGNIIHAKDKHLNLHFEYIGLGKIKKRIENKTQVEFKYNTDEQLVGIVNEHNYSYKFDLDANGDVEIESGFDEIKRFYQRDDVGRPVRVTRASGIETFYEYDPLGRIILIKHSNDETHQFSYREDGELVKAINNSGVVEMEKDSLGRVVVESQNGFTIHSEYNALELRTRLYTSLGLDLTINRNNIGDVLGIKARSGTASWEMQFKRDVMGLELERLLPGEVKGTWERDQLGRPLHHKILAEEGVLQRSRAYEWDTNDRLKRVIDFGTEITQFQHDLFGNLAVTSYPNGQSEYRMPDAVGNLFRNPSQDDRTYGPAGQLLEASGTRYSYDAEGNMIQKVTANGDIWQYFWNASGMLSRVIRPDGEFVTFTYDALGRRTSKSYKGTTTYWVWDGNVPIHEWESYHSTSEGQDHLTSEKDNFNQDWNKEEIVFTERGGFQTDDLISEPISIEEANYSESNTLTWKKAQTIPLPLSNVLVTWLFEPESFVPIGKLLEDEQYSIHTDHLGTPALMYNKKGEKVWAANLDSYGDLKLIEGDAQICSFRYQGQYEDVETGLYYNRFRYYNPDSGTYISQDPIGLLGSNPNLYGYVHDSNSLVDPFGLWEVFDTKANRWRDGESGRFTKDPWSRNAMTLQDQMALESARRGEGDLLMTNMGDERFSGYDKYEVKVKSVNGSVSVVHYVKNPKTGEITDFKFKKHSNGFKCKQ